ncbi:MAG: DUF2110 family protein [Nitrososphaerota archaeon]|jgi:hypothetical protein|uniref:DUF2110 family protein n=1 Tax=Candidatus Bathycorpusculum sp. TaxID=2994959 RepID=UPI00282E6678|nr:DUF2110 family protein [Candidatus Termitimicrobium sp.]MCL2431222.1 DUF2110 family protein [Candidatus Termitimicrobium sp.]MDR0492348.1 DUF2110 family protein [Nitrososphaerota archaeon]
MTNIALLIKTWNGSQLRQIDELLHNQFADLDVDLKIIGNPINRWVQASIEGEDQTIAMAYIRKEIGTCPVSFDAVDVGMVLKGFVSKIDVEKQRLLVDVGVFEPKPTQAAVYLPNLQLQLTNNRDVTLKQLTTAYAITEGLPLSLKIVSKDPDTLTAELSDEQTLKLQGWQQSLLDRLIVMRTSKELVSEVIERTRLDRDVIDIEHLGLFEFALVCKLGTDAAGLIPRMGRYMRNAVFVVFDAKKVRFERELGLTL